MHVHDRRRNLAANPQTRPNFCKLIQTQTSRIRSTVLFKKWCQDEEMQDANVHNGAGRATPESLLTLTEAAKIAPGRPSTNALWRWCRKGVIARSGERIRLEHSRIGARIFTTQAWVAKFGRRLAEADAVYFDRTEPQNASASESGLVPQARSHSRVELARLAQLQQVEQELDAAGL
jgi:hypothetical protein